MSHQTHWTAWSDYVAAVEGGDHAAAAEAMRRYEEALEAELESMPRWSPWPGLDLSRVAG